VASEGSVAPLDARQRPVAAVNLPGPIHRDVFGRAADEVHQADANLT
jgi:hypothetical protein